jgi:hypothetical protein
MTYPESKIAASRTGYPLPLGKLMSESLFQGFSYARCADDAEFLGYQPEAIAAWIKGRKSERRRPGQGQDEGWLLEAAEKCRQWREGGSLT